MKLLLRRDFKMVQTLCAFSRTRWEQLSSPHSTSAQDLRRFHDYASFRTSEKDFICAESSALIFAASFRVCVRKDNPGCRAQKARSAASLGTPPLQVRCPSLAMWHIARFTYSAAKFIFSTSISSYAFVRIVDAPGLNSSVCNIWCRRCVLLVAKYFLRSPTVVFGTFAMLAMVRTE